MAEEGEDAIGTMPALVPAVPTAVATAALEAAKAYARQALAPETLRAYAAHWSAFIAWCRQAGCIPLPADPVAVAAYLAACAPGYSRAALERRLAAIGHQHRLRDLPWSPGHPALRTVLRGIYRQHGSSTRQAAALTSVELRTLVASCGTDLVGRRGRALLLLGAAPHQASAYISCALICPDDLARVRCSYKAVRRSTRLPRVERIAQGLPLHARQTCRLRPSHAPSARP